jgi:phage tail-like protein
MESRKKRYAILRDHRNWEGVTTSGLQAERDGAFTLARIPGAVDGQRITLASPFDSEPSGLAAGDCQDVYIVDTVNHRVIRIDGVCETRMVIPGGSGSGNTLGRFDQPRGLLIANNSLYVADSGAGRVLVFRLPTLELRAIWEDPLQEPVGLAADSLGRVYVLDRGLNSVLRFNGWGSADEPYNTKMANQPDLESPFCVAIDGKDVLYVADDHTNAVLRFDAAGKALDKLPDTLAPLRPRALAARGDRLYVAGAEDGQVWVCDCKAEVYIGSLADYRGPVAAMVVDETGALYIKPGMDESIYRLQADASYVAAGTLTSGPLDAGVDTEWFRVHVQAEAPEGSELTLQTFVSDDPTIEPQDSNWKDALALDILVPPLPVNGNGQPIFKRYLWLRAQLKSDVRRMSPRLVQVRAETSGDSYLNYLPAIYRRDDAPQRFLERWLALFGSKLGDWELAIEEMARRFDPATTPEEYLSWLATWLAFDLPQGAGAGEMRSMLLHAHELYRRRGAPSGIREFVKLYTGVHPHIFEAFRERGVWQLGETSSLGFDTALAAGSPDGMIVPGLTPADPHYLGLRGDYYLGLDFAQLRLTRTDAEINFDDAEMNFDWEIESPVSTDPADKFSVRWSGQLQPRYSEVYTFSTYTDDGVRLWLDGQLIINKWVDQPPTEHSGRIALTAGRWYAITMEYYENGGNATAKLFWSSRSQPREIVPSSRLYSVRDENADLESPSPGETLLVGRTVVGESGLLAASDFGMPLFSETAHLFTVAVAAAQVPEASRRSALREVVDAEKPAHTDFHLCFIDARMRVGFQSRIGIDSIVAGPPTPMELDGATLGFDSYLAAKEDEGHAARVGKHARIGCDAVIA